MGLSIHFINQSDAPANVKVYHAGCGELPWMEGIPQCWWTTVEPHGPNGVYVPSDWVTNFATWIDIIIQGVVAVVVTAATAGAGTPEVVAVEVAADTGEAAGEAAYTMSNVAEEIVGEGASESASEAADAIESSGALTKIKDVASSLKMSWKALSNTTRAVAKAIGAEAVAVPATVGFAYLCGDWRFAYSQNGKIYKAKTTFQHGGNFYFYIGPECDGLWEYMYDGD